MSVPLTRTVIKLKPIKNNFTTKSGQNFSPPIMVSLKSFKLINEGERDEASYQSNDITQRQASVNHHQSTFYSEPSKSNKQQDAINLQSEVISSIDQKRADRIEPEESNKLTQTSTMSRNAGKLQGSSENGLVSNMRGSSKSILKVSSSDRASKSSIHPQENDADGKTVSPSTSSISIVVVNHDNPASTRNTTSDDDFTQDESSSHSTGDLEDTEGANNMKINGAIPTKPTGQLGGGSYYNGTAENVGSGLLSADNLRLYTEAMKGNESRLPANTDPAMAIAINGQHFEIVWSNLSYRIEPKWYKKINFLDRIFSHFMPGQTIDNHSSATSTASSSAGMNDNQHQMHTSTNADSHLNSNLSAKQKSALDPIEIFTNLNGTIKSGQMTAVLGPSGKYHYTKEVPCFELSNRAGKLASG